MFVRLMNNVCESVHNTRKYGTALPPNRKMESCRERECRIEYLSIP